MNLIKLLYNKEHKAGDVMGAISYESMSCEAQEWCALTYSTPGATVYISYELSQFIFWGYNWFDRFFK